MRKADSKKAIAGLALLFSLTYMVSYITRINYGAVISAMEAETGQSKSLLSMALTGSFITYGAGQIVSGLCGDRFSPKKLISLGLLATACMNLLLPLCQNHIQMLIIWSINGFAQSFMWPPMVKLMTALLTAEDYKTVTTKVSFGSSFGTVAVYLFSPLLLMLSGFKAVFFCSAFCALAVFIIWQKCAPDINAKKIQKREMPKETQLSDQKTIKLISPLMFLIMTAIILQGALRDGVTTWMPSYIKETYHIDGTLSVLTGVFLPLFSIFCFYLAEKLYEKRLKNPLFCAMLFFGIGTLSALLLLLFSGKQAGISIFSLALLTGCMHGVNLMLICMIPPYFEKSGKVSTVSGILNSCTYIGSALSTYGIALLAEHLGWNFNLCIWLATAFSGTVLCLLCAYIWKKKQIGS